MLTTPEIIAFSLLVVVSTTLAISGFLGIY